MSRSSALFGGGAVLIAACIAALLRIRSSDELHSTDIANVESHEGPKVAEPRHSVPEPPQRPRQPLASQYETSEALVEPPVTPTMPAPAARSRYVPPTDPRELAKRFFGEEAQAIAEKWEGEPVSPGAADVENNILTVYIDSETDQAIRGVECRSTLCRIQLDRKLATEDHAGNKRMAGKLGVNGWMLTGRAPDELLTFVPIDFVPM
jgi:hypothetical protein